SAGGKTGSRRHDLHASGTLARPVIRAWKQQRNTADLRRNAAAWRETPRPSDTARSWRTWLRPGIGSPKRPRKKPLTQRPDRTFPLRLGVPPRLPGGATPAPLATRWPEL